MTTAGGGPRPGRRGLLTAAVAVVGLAAVSTVTAAAASGAFASRSGPAGWGYAGGHSTCAAPALTGRTVGVRLMDMGMMAGRGRMMGGAGPAVSGGAMRIVTSTASVPAGTVSLLVTNAGHVTHELVALPLAAGAAAGDRVPGADGTVDETGSLGEASATCAAGTGDGIAAGAAGWVTLRLPAGRYELICNLPGHYAAGMYAELDVR